MLIDNETLVFMHDYENPPLASIDKFKEGDSVEYVRFDRWAIHEAGRKGIVEGIRNDASVMVRWENGELSWSSILYLKQIIHDDYEDILI